jgi:hypothetical protein
MKDDLWLALEDIFYNALGDEAESETVQNLIAILKEWHLYPYDT